MQKFLSQAVHRYVIVILLNTSIMEKVFYQISDPTQNVPEGDDNWIEQLKQEKIVCECGSIIKHTAIDVFLSETIKKRI